MSLSQDIFETVIKEPAEGGFTSLRVFSGFASSAFAYYLLELPLFSACTLDLTVGMAPAGEVAVWDHQEFQRLESGRFQCKYFLGPNPSHSKMFVWSSRHHAGMKAFIGSANFSWGGFRDLTETVAEVDAASVLSLFPRSDQMIRCTDPQVDEKIRFSFESSRPEAPVDAPALGSFITGKPSITLSLLTSNGKMPERSGLNWGQRPGRDHAQAYIAIPRIVHQEAPGFFPPKEQEFTIVTDDGHQFICVVAQDNDKAIETKRDNAELGRYLRRRLGLSDDDFVEKESLIRYGRTDVTIFRLDSGTFYMDFSVNDQ